MAQGLGTSITTSRGRVCSRALRSAATGSRTPSESPRQEQPVAVPPAVLRRELSDEVLGRDDVAEDRGPHRCADQVTAESSSLGKKGREVGRPFEVRMEHPRAAAKQHPRGEPHQLGGAVGQENAGPGREVRQGPQGTPEAGDAGPVSEARVTGPPGIRPVAEEVLEAGRAPFLAAEVAEPQRACCARGVIRPSRAVSR